MKIAYTYHAFMDQRYGGITRYFSRLAGTLRRLGAETMVFPGIHQNGHLSTAEPGVARGLNLGWLPVFPKGLVRPFNQALAGWQIGRWRPDIVHETFYWRSGIPRTKAPVVLTVYDLINEKFPDNSYKAAYNSALKRAALQRADHIICISECTRRDLLACYDVRGDKVSTVHLGVDPVSQTEAPGRDRERLILHVGPRARYKNFARLVRAFASSPILSSDYRLVAFGWKPFSPAEWKLFAEAGLKPGQVAHATGDDTVLSELYACASVFVYPSLYEGFGIPPLEAMAHGCPVAASDCSSIPEVLGDAAVLFDPCSVDSMRAAIERVVADRALGESLVRRGRDRVARFTWEACARKTLGVYRRLLS